MTELNLESSLLDAVENEKKAYRIMFSKYLAGFSIF